MRLLRHITTALLCSVAPTVLIAQAVELRSADNFISVEGEIIGYNGVMVTIQTTVGAVSVPATEVVCYGAGCAEVVGSNSFGLTAASFAGIVDQSQAEAETLTDTFAVGFATAAYGTLYQTLSAAFAEADTTTVSADTGADGALTLQNGAGNETAILSLATSGEGGDIVLAATTLKGSAPQEYVGPSGWISASTPPYQLVALRAFAVVTAADVGVEAITMDQLAGIYAGEITNWAQIGGADLTVLPLQLPVSSDLRNELIAVVMEPAGKSIADNVLTMADEASIAAAIGGFAGSISVVNVGNSASARVLPVAGSCGIAVAPTTFNVASGDYPLIVPVMARFDSSATTSVIAELFDFAATDNVQDLLAGGGFVDHGTGFQSPVDRNKRLTALLTANLDPEERPVAAQMFQSLFEAERLTPTMTGGQASGPEGAWNRAMMRNLIELLLQPDYAGREVIFAGFADSAAGPVDAIEASRRAAAAMAEAFNTFAPAVVAGNDLTVSSVGFGNVSPTTCYDGQVAGTAHSRIEVWLK
jgi:phosphate transport system substrate-binding protein